MGNLTGSDHRRNTPVRCTEYSFIDYGAQFSSIDSDYDFTVHFISALA